MASRQFQTTVGTSATPIEGTQYPGWILHNSSPNTTIFLGGSDVTDANGFPIPESGLFSPSELAHKSLTGKLEDRLYGIVTSASVDVRVLIQGRPSV